MRKSASVFLWAAAAVLLSAVGSETVWARGAKGAQYLATENLQDEKTLEKFVDSMTTDTKGKFFGKLKKVIIPTYYIEYRTVSSGKAVNKGVKDVSVNATVTYANPDKAVMEEIAAAGLADLKTRLAAAGFEVVEAGDLNAIPKYKELKPFASGTIGESTAQPIGWAKFMSMYASAGGAPIYIAIPGEPAPDGGGIRAVMDAAHVDGALWKNAGGDGVGILRPRMVIDFITFVADKGTTYDMEGWKKYASLTAVPQVQSWLASLCTTNKYVFFAGRAGGDKFGCVNVDPNVQLASKDSGAALGKLEETDGKWLFTADNDKYKAAAIEQVKIANALLVGKAKSYK